MKRKILSVVLSLAIVFALLPICSPVANAVAQAPGLTYDFNVIGANGYVYVAPPSDVGPITTYYYRLSDVGGSAPALDSTDLTGYTPNSNTERFYLGACPNGTTKYVQVIKVESGQIKEWGQKEVTPQTMVEYDGTSTINAHGLAITLKQGTDPSKTKIYLNTDLSTPAAIFVPSGTPTLYDGAYDLSGANIYGNRDASVTTTSITMDGGKVKGIYGGTGITSSAAIVINGGSCEFIRGAGSIGDETHKAGIVINGGNVSNLATYGGAVKVKSGTDSTVTINGGFIYDDIVDDFIINAIPKNSAGNEVKKYTLTLKNSGAAVTNTTVSALTTSPELGYTYGVNNVKTDANGKLYVFLPDGVSTVSVVADGQTYGGTVTSNAATLVKRSTAPTVDVTSITKTAAVQQSVSYTLTNSSSLSGTCTVYADNTTTAAISTVTAAISGSEMILSSTGTDIAAGDYYVAVTEADKSESPRLKLTVGAYTPQTAPRSGGGGGSASTLVTKIESGESVADTNVGKLVQEGESLTVEGKAGEKLVFDTEALKNIDGQTKERVTVEIKDVSSDYKNEHPDRLVVSLSVTAGGKHITSFGNGTATVSLPYELKAGEKAGDVTVWYLAEDGTMTEVPCTYDPATKMATFKVNHFSLYVVGTADTGKWTNPFSDVKESSWYYDAVRYVSANEMMQGTKDTAFSPNGKTTRGMIVTILWRMENQPKATKEITFNDVKTGKYYHDAVAWASEKGIVGGYSAEKFGPEDNITREQLAVILHNYAAIKGYKTETAADLSVFGDAGRIHSWSKDSMSWASGKGLITGTGSGLLNPLGAAERCQVAAILQRFVENTSK